jgi:AcrR family transcriptional regulator
LGGAILKKGIETRQNIIAQALQLFSVKGYYNTSINDIIEATSLTKGGLYGHFRSKEDIWYAVHDEAVKIWRSKVLKNVQQIQDPLERIEATIINDMRAYLGADVFDGGCFFFNMLVELSGQSSIMTRHILRGFVQFARLLRGWLEEAEQKNILKVGLDLKGTANFIVIALNGAAPLYSASRDSEILENTIRQLQFYLKQLRK